MSAKTVVVLVIAAVGVGLACEAMPVSGRSGEHQEIVTSDVKIIQDFEKRVQTVLDLRKKLQKDAPPLPEEATPQQLDAHQRALEKLMRAARADAKQGDIFTPDIQALIRKAMVQIIARPDGRQIRASVLDENPVGLKIQVNDRYPDKVPLATMPPQLLARIPKLPEGLEYRFVGDALVLLDPISHVILDFVPKALPE